MKYLQDPKAYRIANSNNDFKLIKKSMTETNSSRHFHPFWEIMYIISGKRKLFLANRTLNIAEGTFIFIKPGILHRALNPPGENCCLYNLYFDNPNYTTFKTILPLLEECGSCIVLSKAMHGKILKLFSQLGLELLEKGFASEEMAQSILIQIFALLAREARSTEDAEKRLARLIIPNDSMNPTISQIIDYLNIHYCENISLNSIAKKFGITESHLSRIFKNASHFTFVEYINSLRITRCCRILIESNKTMLEIAELCGFGSITQFGRCFKKYTGKAPLQYKKEALSKLK